MADHIAWLKKELEKARKRMDDKFMVLANAQVEWHGAKQEYLSIERTLKVTQGKHGRTARDYTEDAKPELPSSRLTLPVLVKHHLRENGPTSPDDLLQMLRKYGRAKTTVNSLNTVLRRFRPEKFDRNKKGEWYLVEQEDKKD